MAYTTAEEALEAASSRFVRNNPLSKAQHELACLSLPGGNTRTVLHTDPFPLTMKRGKGAYVWDLDGHKYLDLTAELSAGLYGHSHPLIRQILVGTFDEIGVSLGSTTVAEQEFAALICQRFDFDKVRMTNSGTEANLHALACARAFTGRKRFVVFKGGYHGAVLSFPHHHKEDMEKNVVDGEQFVVVPGYNELEIARGSICEIGKRGELAGVLVEAMQGAGGCILGGKEFLHGVQEETHRWGGVFILDEVMTSRLAPGGLGRDLGLKPDLVTLGKYLGGGLAFGCFGGREELMAVYDPRSGVLAHSGTFNNNTLVMRVGYEALKGVYTDEVCREFNKRGDGLRRKLEELVKGTRLSVTGLGSLMTLHFTEEGERGGNERADLRDLFWFEMLEEGFWITRRGMIALILETKEEELDGFLEAVGRFLQRRMAIMGL
ncbi:pyridoxal phosphate-dependent transferase [Cladorrhinum sp. PSN259]|nr:pyridoxal phosphate-dependent transferase [Cladorrhinum sp. PSN259]